MVAERVEWPEGGASVFCKLEVGPVQLRDAWQVFSGEAGSAVGEEWNRGESAVEHLEQASELAAEMNYGLPGDVGAVQNFDEWLEWDEWRDRYRREGWSWEV